MLHYSFSLLKLFQCCILHIYSFNSAIFFLFFSIPIGVADGVGGWRNFGFDPSKFSYSLMDTCERLVVTGRFNPRNPGHLIATSYYELKENKEQIIGKDKEEFHFQLKNFFEALQPIFDEE